ncbi:hypothetical protein, variant 1 [Aphanomyces astaci]|uniref:JmjC domain-containing protein n=1 Tax=Aphanomyces astaci TaxID=112090 RepID=W4FH56_APHAT|nr:hypothetical protein, variant 1 [Aphanomyces astaci]ETV66194.1 hypothetical protein, variant 1 [Aphanomyces astaci]|eukprot:XP_009844383.1 hypothetical protein, variant 1 [Aphanomyces astaci]
MRPPPSSPPMPPPPDTTEEISQLDGRGTITYVREWLSRWAKLDHFNAAVVNGENVTKEWLHEVGFTQPFVVLDKVSLGLTVPSPSFTVEDLASVVGQDAVVSVLEVTSQRAVGDWSLGRWAAYMNTPSSERTQQLTVPSFSHAGLSRLLTPPRFVRQVGWAESVWVHSGSLPPPPTSTYCVMAPKDSFVDFDMNMGGSSMWYSVLRGKQVVYVVPPTSDNLAKFKLWSANHNPERCFGDVAASCAHVVLTGGSTLLIPPGWLYAVATLDQDVVGFKGYFLESFNLPTHVECVALERYLHGRSRFPQYDQALWHVACSHLKAQETTDMTALSRLLDPSAADAADIAIAHGFPSAASVLAALQSTAAASSSGSSSGGSSSSSSSSSSSDDDDDDVSSGSEVDTVAYPKFVRENVTTNVRLKVLTPLVIPILDAANLSTNKSSSSKAKRKATKSSVEQWYFECSCGDKGSNYDDGKRMVQCDVCVTWQHTACAGIPNETEPPTSYKCFKCLVPQEDGGAPSTVVDWTVSCSCGIVAVNYDDGCRMIACDRCNTWQHTLCAGIPNETEPPDVYLCRSCKTHTKKAKDKSPRAAVKSPKTQQPVRKPARKPPQPPSDDDDDDDDDQDVSPPSVVPSKKQRSSKRAKRTAAAADGGENVRPVLKAAAAATVATADVPKKKQQPTSVRERLVKKLKMKPKWGRM